MISCSFFFLSFLPAFLSERHFSLPHSCIVFFSNPFQRLKVPYVIFLLKYLRLCFVLCLVYGNPKKTRSLNSLFPNQSVSKILLLILQFPFILQSRFQICISHTYTLVFLIFFQFPVLLINPFRIRSVVNFDASTAWIGRTAPILTRYPSNSSLRCRFRWEQSLRKNMLNKPALGSPI